MSAGIDYGMGLSNRDPSNGIRFGVISQNSIMPEALSDMETDYPEVEHEGGDRCEREVCSCGDMNEPSGYSYTKDGYRLFSGTDGFGVFVECSPFYTFARFCSPCAPGAGNLDSPDPDGIKTYCLGLDWFDGDSPCPYPVYSVATGNVVTA